MDDDEEVREIPDKYQVLLWMKNTESAWVYEVQHWSPELPATELVVMLLDEAKQTFGALYPGVAPTDFSVLVQRLRPADDYRPDFRALL